MKLFIVDDDAVWTKVLFPQLLKKCYENIQIIFCTFQKDLSIAIRTIEYGSKDFLLKTNLDESEFERLLSNMN